jgi:cobalt-zinc-cadmium efflux system outer membrane protein
MRRFAPIGSGLALVVSTGLAAPVHAQSTFPSASPLGRSFPTFVAPSDPNAVVQEAPEPEGVLRLSHALGAALLGSPDLAAQSFEVRAGEAALLQARLRPNPTLSTQVEDIVGSGAFSKAGESETTIQLGLLVELGGKRADRMRVAGAARQLAGWDYETLRIDVFSRTADAFVEVLAAQERLALADDALVVVRRIHDIAQRRVDAGRASPADAIRAGVAVDSAGVEREHADHGLETARTTLAAQWGGVEARFDRAEGDLADVPAPPPLAELQRRAAESPDLARWAAELESREAAIAEARSGRIPDITVHAGPRYLAGPDDVTLVVGASIPIPLWSRNQGAIAEARSRRAKAAHAQRAARVRAFTEVSKSLTALHASIEEAALLRTRVLPGIDRAVAALQRGYEAGRNSQLEMLEIIATRLAAREQHLRALVEAHHSVQRLERLTGAPLQEETP